MNKQILRNTIFTGLFLIPFVPFLVYGGFFFPFITTKAFAFRIIVEIIFGAYVILAIVDSSYRPRWTPIFKAILVFLGIVGLANLFGLEPIKSFWSNFERMEGYVTMLHLGALFVVMSSVFRDREWRWWWNTSLVASLIMVLYCLFQIAGVVKINQGGVRVDGRLGNAAYLALYLLIHIFIALYYFAKSKSSGLRWAYGFLMLGQIIILYYTATRGATLGFVGGLFIVGLLNLFNKEDERLRKWSRYSLVALVLLLATFFAFRNSSVVQSSPVMSRFSNISLSSLKTEGRAFVWPMAIKGIKERPVLGWGQDNFNYVFAEHYSAEMYKIEPWFDRAHNIFLDWGISAGLLGLLSYLSLYVVLLIQIWKRENSLNFLERSTLTGLIAGYFFNNFFVFDNLTSYVLFFSLLAYIHSKSVMLEKNESTSNNERDLVLTTSIVGAVVLVSIYFVNIKPIIANTKLIDALNGKDMIQSLEKAYESSRLGRPEVVEWISSVSTKILSDQGIPMEERNAFFEFAKGSMESVTQELSGDPRYEIVAGSFYLPLGMNEDALRHFNKAKELMPEKQIIYFNLGQLYLQQGKNKEGLAYFKTAYDLAPEYEEAKMIYLIGALYAKDYVLINELLTKIDPATLLNDARILSVMYQTGQKSLLLSTLRNLKTKLPDRKSDIDEYIKQIESGS